MLLQRNRDQPAQLFTPPLLLRFIPPVVQEFTCHSAGNGRTCQEQCQQGLPGPAAPLAPPPLPKGYTYCGQARRSLSPWWQTSESRGSHLRSWQTARHLQTSGFWIPLQGRAAGTRSASSCGMGHARRWNQSHKSHRLGQTGTC